MSRKAPAPPAASELTIAQGRTRGKPPLLTELLIDKIAAEIRMGSFFAPACRIHGIKPDTGYEWMARGEGRDPDRADDPLYAQFALAVRKAEAELERELVLAGIKAAKGRSSAADILRILKARFRERWGDHVELGAGSGAAPKQVTAINVFVTNTAGENPTQVASTIVSMVPGTSDPATLLPAEIEDDDSRRLDDEAYSRQERET